MRYERPKKLILSGLKTVPFSPFVDQSSPNMAHMYGSDRSMQCHFPVTVSCLQSGYICNKVAKWCCGKLRFSAQKFLGRRTPKIWCGHL